VAAEAATREHGSFEVKSTWLGKKFIAMMHPDNQKKLKTFARMNPSNSNLTKAVLNEFLKHQNDLLDALKNISNANLNKGRIPVEFFKLIKLSLAEALQFVIVHEQRHVNQAMRSHSKVMGASSTLVV
jgi:hypothetical protein